MICVPKLDKIKEVDVQRCTLEMILDFEVLDNISYSIDNVLECICAKLYLSLKRSIIVSYLHSRPSIIINITIDFMKKNFSGKNVIHIFVVILM